MSKEQQSVQDPMDFEDTFIPRVQFSNSDRIPGLKIAKREAALNTLIQALEINCDSKNNLHYSKALTRVDFEIVAVRLESELFNDHATVESYQRRVNLKANNFKKTAMLAEELVNYISEKEKVDGPSTKKFKLVKVLGQMVRVATDSSSPTSSTDSKKDIKFKVDIKDDIKHKPKSEFIDPWSILNPDVKIKKSDIDDDPDNDNDEIICVQEDKSDIKDIKLNKTRHTTPFVKRKRRGSESMLAGLDIDFGDDEDIHIEEISVVKQAKLETKEDEINNESLNEKEDTVNENVNELASNDDEKELNPMTIDAPLEMETTSMLDIAAASSHSDSVRADKSTEKRTTEVEIELSSKESSSNSKNMVTESSKVSISTGHKSIVELQPIITRTVPDEIPPASTSTSTNANDVKELELESIPLLTKIKQEPAEDSIPKLPKKKVMEEEATNTSNIILNALRPYLTNGKITSHGEFLIILKKLNKKLKTKGLKGKKEIEDYIALRFGTPT